jgi:hypothetical protein
MKAIRFLGNHACFVKKNFSNEAARKHSWLFCPWCKAELAQIVEVDESPLHFAHIYETNSDRSKHIPASGERFEALCGQSLEVVGVFHHPLDVPRRFCPLCTLHQSPKQPLHTFFLVGIAQPSPAGKI